MLVFTKRYATFKHSHENNRHTTHNKTLPQTTMTHQTPSYTLPHAPL